LDDLLDNQEDCVLVFYQMPELINLGKVSQELTVERHSLVGELVVRPVLFNDPVDYRKHDLLFIVSPSQKIVGFLPFTRRRLFHQHDDILEKSVFVLTIDVKDRLLLRQVRRESQYLHGLNMREPIPKNGRNIFMNHKNIINHRIHLRVPEQNGKVVTQDFLQLIALLMVAYRVVLDLK
jgi:hypothetical protein